MPYEIRFDHHLEIDGVPLSTPAWEHLDIQALYAGPVTRGENRVMPGAAGQRALPWRRDLTMRTLTLAIFGDVTWEGVANDDAVDGLWANIAHLTTNIVDTPPTPDCTRTAVIKRAGHTDLTATIQVRGFEILEAYGPSSVSASLDIALMAGRFT